MIVFDIVTISQHIPIIIDTTVIQNKHCHIITNVVYHLKNISMDYGIILLIFKENI